MKEEIPVVRLCQPEKRDAPLTDILRRGARRLLARAVELAAEAFLAEMKERKLADGRGRLVRHGPERAIQTGIGPVRVSRVKIRDRGGRPGRTASASPWRFCRCGRRSPPSHRPHQGRAVAHDRQADGLQTRHRRSPIMAAPEGRKSVAESRPGRHIRHWCRVQRAEFTTRRPKPPSPSVPQISHTFDAALVVAETKRHRIFDTDDSPWAALVIALGVYTVVAILRSFWAY